jgi:hypothetical protein
VAFRDSRRGILGGGDLASNASAATATSEDGGETWTLTNKPPVQGAIFCLAYVRGNQLSDGHGHDGGDGRTDDEGFDHNLDHAVVITAETEPDFSSGAAAWTPDEGRTWYQIPGASGYWAVGFASPKAGWFVGNNGQILKISF